MNRPQSSRSTPDLGSLVRDFAPRGAPVGDCPDPNVLSGYAEGRVLDAEREALAAHLVQCEACRSLVAEIAGAAPLVPSRTGWRWQTKLLWLAAAVLLGAGIAFGPDLVRSLSSSTATTEERLVAAVRELAAAQPALFASFEPMSEAERRAPGTSTERGGVVLLHPCETILTTRPHFVWEPVPGAQSYEVALSTADGNLIWRSGSDVARLSFPRREAELQRGRRYLWKLTARGPAGEDAAGRSFTVADDAAAAALAASMQAIDERIDGGLAPLVRAHFALRHGLVAEAASAARAFLAAHGDDRIGQETLMRALSLMGATNEETALSVDHKNSAPVCDRARSSIEQLWPSDHALQSVAIVGVTDPDGDEVEIKIVDVTQDEPIRGLGESDQAPDAILQGGSVLLRAERDGNGNGRIYRVVFEASDGSEIRRSSVTVGVPTANGGQCVDDGQRFHSIGS